MLAGSNAEETVNLRIGLGSGGMLAVNGEFCGPGAVSADHILKFTLCNYVVQLKVDTFHARSGVCAVHVNRVVRGPIVSTIRASIG